METASVQTIRMHLAAASTLGVDTAALFSASGLSQEMLRESDSRIPLEKAILLIETLAAQAKVPSYGLWLGEHFHPTQLGVAGYLLMNASTLESALESFCHYQRIIGDAFVWQLNSTHPETRALTLVENRLKRLGEIATEWSALSILTSMRVLSGRSISPIAVEFPHFAPDWKVQCKMQFGCPIIYEKPTCCLVFRTLDLNYSVQHADNQLKEQLEAIAQTILHKLKTDTPMRQRVLSLLLPWLPGQEPKLDAVARKLGVSGRALQDSLKKENCSFRKLVGQVQMELALTHLKDRRLSIGDVSYLLGFSEPSAFHRAFKKWTGNSPGHYRP